jgi:hypothetical protein
MTQIDELTASVAALAARVAALERGAAPPKIILAPEEDGVRILTGRAASGESRLLLPSDEELRRLREIVAAAYPHLAFRPRNERYATADEAEDHRGFASAFAWLAEQARSDQLDTRKATGWYVDGANNQLRDRGLSAEISGRTFVAALVAHGDIPFTALDDYPVFGLTHFGAGRPYSQKWREVLALGKILAPVAKPGPRPAPPSPTQLLIVGEQGMRA